MKNNYMELLAPAGSMEALKAAANHGADAIYAGGAKFGARAYADNFSKESMIEAIDFLHMKDKKLYLTVNTLLKSQELYEQLYEEIEPLYRNGLDGVIIQDLGVFSFLKQTFPELELHASTQMTVTSPASAIWLKEQGASRIVPARELSLSEIGLIKDEAELEIEVFIHGALCYCYSGQCLYSSMLGGRSGNRGRCAQPCRLSYDIDGQQAYYMSLKDLNGLAALPDLLEAGVDSLKIEGRMKSPEYTAATVSVYRKHLDRLYAEGRDGYRIDQQDVQMLEEIFNRGGFTSGYYERHNGAQMLTPYRPNHYGHQVGEAMVKNGQLSLKLKQPALAKDVLEIRNAREDSLEKITLKQSLMPGVSKHSVNMRGEQGMQYPVYRVHSEEVMNYWKKHALMDGAKRPINGFAAFFLGQPMTLTVIDEKTGKSAVVEGAVVEGAKSAPATEEQLTAGLQKTGDTPFAFSVLEVACEDGVFVPKQQLNSLRREALQMLMAQLLQKNEVRPMVLPPVFEAISGAGEAGACKLHATVTTMEQLEVVLGSDGISRVYIEDHLFIREREALTACIDRYKTDNEGKKELFLAMPYIFRLQAQTVYELQFLVVTSLFDGVLVRNLDSFAFVCQQEYNGTIVCDHSVYAWNPLAAKMYLQAQEMGAAVELTAPQELNSTELKYSGVPYQEITAYGRSVLMVTANCIRKTRVRVEKEQHGTTGKAKATCCDGRQEILYLKDRYNKKFPVLNQCSFCYNLIWNCDCLNLMNQTKQILGLGIRNLRLHFTTETAAQCKNVIEDFTKQWLENEAVENPMAKGSFTRGHFKRGVE